MNSKNKFIHDQHLHLTLATPTPPAGLPYCAFHFALTLLFIFQLFHISLLFDQSIALQTQILIFHSCHLPAVRSPKKTNNMSLLPLSPRFSSCTHLLPRFKHHHSNFSILINPMARGGYDVTGLHPSSAGYIARSPQHLAPTPMTNQFQVQPQGHNFINGTLAPFGVMRPQQQLLQHHHVFQPQAHPPVTHAMLSWQPLYPKPHAQIRWP